MTVVISAKMQALVKNGFSGSFAVIDDAVSRKANPILLESVRNDKRQGDVGGIHPMVGGIHPMRDRLQNRDKGAFLYIDPLLDDERSVNQIMAGLGFNGKPIVFDKSRSSSVGTVGL
jgi:hypothetical protein